MYFLSGLQCGLNIKSRSTHWEGIGGNHTFSTRENKVGKILIFYKNFHNKQKDALSRCFTFRDRGKQKAEK